MLTGKVKWFIEDKGYGFIKTDKGESIFVHYSDITGKGYKSLKRDENVKFDVMKTDKGLKAINVEKIH